MAGNEEKGDVAPDFSGWLCSYCAKAKGLEAPDGMVVTATEGKCPVCGRTAWLVPESDYHDTGCLWD